MIGKFSLMNFSIFSVAYEKSNSFLIDSVGLMVSSLLLFDGLGFLLIEFITMSRSVLRSEGLGFRLFRLLVVDLFSSAYTLEKS
jgi:hypothetical protein